MRLAGLIFTVCIATVAARPQDSQQDCSKCPEKGIGQGALWSGKDFTGDCACFEANNHCVNLADINL